MPVARPLDLWKGHRYSRQRLYCALRIGRSDQTLCTIHVFTTNSMRHLPPSATNQAPARQQAHILAGRDIRKNAGYG